MAESLLSKIVKTDKKTFKTIESIDKRMSVLVTAQQKQIKHRKQQQKLDQKILQEEKRKKADSSLANKIKNVLGGDKEKTKGWFSSFLGEIGDLLKTIAPIALVGALGIGLIGTALYKFFTDEKFRKALMDNIISPFFNAVGQGLADIGATILQWETGNPVVRNPIESTKSKVDDTLTRLFEGVERSAPEKALTTIRDRISGQSAKDLGITDEERDLRLKRLNKTLRILRENEHAKKNLKIALELTRNGFEKDPVGWAWPGGKEQWEKFQRERIIRHTNTINQNNERLTKLQNKILKDTNDKIDIGSEIVAPEKVFQGKQSGGLVSNKDKTDPRYKLGKMEMRGFNSESQDDKNETFIKRQQGGLVLFAGHNDVPNGHEQPGTDAPGTDLQGKYKPTAEQHFADEVARETQALAKKEGVPISYQPSTGRYWSGDHPDSNWSKMGRIRSSGGSAIELHFDAYGYDGGRLVQGTRGMIINGYSLSENEKKVQRAFGTHPTGDSFGGLILELDTINKAPGNSKSYAKMIVDAMEGVTGPAPEVTSSSGGGGGGGTAGKVSSAQPAPRQKNIIERISEGFGIAGQAIGAVAEAFMEVFGDELGALFGFGGGKKPGAGNNGNKKTGNNNKVSPSPNGKSVLLAAGTNDYGTPDLAANNIKKMVELLKDKKYNTTFVSPTVAGKFADVSTKTTAAASGAGASTLMPTRWDSDGYHIHMDEAKKIRDNHPGSVIIGDSNAARIEGTNGTAGRTKVGAGTSEILGFVDGLANVEAKQTGGIVGSHGSQDSMMMTMSEQQFFDRLQEQFEVIDVHYPVTPPLISSQDSGGGQLDFDTLGNSGFDEAMRFAAGSAYS